MFFFLCILFLAIGVFALLPIKKDKYYKCFYFFVGFVLFITIAFRGEGVDKDYLSYIKYFNNLNYAPYSMVEPSFKFFVYLIKTFFFNEVLFLFIVYAFLGVTIKLYAIKELSDFWLLSLLVYLSYSYTLQDMTQIRVGVAVSFLLLCIKPMYDRNFVLFVLFALLAFLFHFSAILIFLLWFINPNKINVLFYSSILVVSFILNIYHLNLTTLIGILPITAIQYKVLAYKSQQGIFLNVLNAWQLMRCCICFILLMNSYVIQKYNRYGILLIKIYVFSACSYFLLSDIAVFASRTSDMLAIVDIVVLPFLLYFVRPKIIATICVILISLSYFYLNLFYNKILL